MPHFSKTPSSHIAAQQGATLIVVLMIVLLLSLIGAIVVRNSQVSQDISTASQVQNLLKQSSDAPLARLQLASVDKNDGDAKTQIELMEANSQAPLQFLQLEGEQKNYEYILCYRPTERLGLYEKGEHRMIGNGAGTTVRKDGSGVGYCHINSNNNPAKYYTSGRSVVASQVALSRPTVNKSSDDDVEAAPFAVASQGSDMDSIGGSQAIRLRATVTSVLPSLSVSSTLEQVDECLQKAVGGLAGNQTEDNQILCLNAQDVPVNFQVQDFAYQSTYD